MKKTIINNFKELNGLESKNYFIVYDEIGGAVMVGRKDAKAIVASLSVLTPVKTLANSLKAYGFNVTINREKKVEAVEELYNVNVNGAVQKLTLQQIKDLEAILGKKVNFEKVAVEPKKVKVNIGGVSYDVDCDEIKKLKDVLSGGKGIDKAHDDKVQKEESEEEKKAKIKAEIGELKQLVDGKKATVDQIKRYFALQGIRVLDLSYKTL